MASNIFKSGFRFGRLTIRMLSAGSVLNSTTPNDANFRTIIRMKGVGKYNAFATSLTVKNRSGLLANIRTVSIAEMARTFNKDMDTPYVDRDETSDLDAEISLSGQPNGTTEGPTCNHKHT